MNDIKDIQREELRILKTFDTICKKHNINYTLAYGTLIGAMRHQGFIPWDDDVDTVMTRESYDYLKTIIEKELPDDMFFTDGDIEDQYWYGFGKIRSKNIEMKEKSTTYTGIHQGVWIDIFPFDALPNDPIEKAEFIHKIKSLHNKFVMFVYTYASPKQNLPNRLIRGSLRIFNILTHRWNPFLKKWYKEREALMTRYNSDQSLQDLTCLCDNVKEEDYDLLKISKDEINDIIYVDFEGEKFPVPRAYDRILSSFYGDWRSLPPLEERVSNHTFE